MTVVGHIRRETAPEAVARWRAARADICAVVFAPRSVLTLSQWADRYRMLSSDLSEPGPWRTSRVPYLRRIMDAITDPRVRRVSVMKSARIGATQALVLNAIGYYIHQEPTPIIVGLPTVDDAQKFSTQLLQPMLDDTPALSGRVAAPRTKKRRNTMLQKFFPGGGLQIVGTTSPRAMRMVHGRVILKSEVDAWIGSAGTDGDPSRLIERRAGTYGSPKFVEESTPLVKETSRIEPAFEAGSREFLYVPCPHCKEYQRLVWGGKEVHYGIRWDRKPNGDPDLESVYYCCQPNGCEIREPEKYAMVAAHEWQATYPERREHLSFHLNALVSPFDMARWPRLVREWTDAQRKPEQLRVFVNTILGETYVEQGAQADAHVLAARREETWWDDEAPVPTGAALLTRSVDTQGDRLETAVWAWGAGEECWLIDHEILPGDPATRAPWDALDERLGQSYRHAGGRALIPSVTFIDAGGHHAKQVNEFARARQARRVFAVFGATAERAPVLGKPTRNNAAKTIQYPVGSFTAKEALMLRLARLTDPGPGYIHLPPWIEDEQLHQLTAEKLVERGPKRVWRKTRARNEMTDLWVYALAALHQLGPATVQQLGAIAARLTASDDGAPAPPPTPARRVRANPRIGSAWGP
jgi:terminase, large subunit